MNKIKNVRKANKYKTHLKRLVEQRTEELWKAKESAEAMSVIKSEFIANMSHELRTPLNSIIGFAKLMELGYDPDLYNEQVNSILVSGGHILKLINDILDLSKIEAGKIHFENEPVYMPAVLAYCINMLSVQAKNKNITIIDFSDLKTVNVIGDEKRLQEVFLNLLSNAVKFTKPGGKVEIKSTVNRDFLFIDIADNGIGIKEENLEIIFREFIQVGSDPEDNYELRGTGLGLAIARRIIDAHNGTITVKSKFGRGSVFTVMLPCIELSGRMETGEKHGNNDYPDYVKDMLFLIVDDEAKNRNLLSYYLKFNNQKHMMAKNGEECLLMMQEYSFALVLMDIRMNGMDGIETMKRIKATNKIPVVAITAYSMEDTRKKLLHEGFDEYISKPVDFNRLTEIIGTLL